LEENIENKQEENTPVVKNTKKNNWKITSFVLGILLVVSIISSTGLISISGNAVATDAVDFINNEMLQGQTTATLEDVTKESGLIKATINVQGQATPIYISKDGSLMFVQAPIRLSGQTPLNPTPQQAPVEVPKADKPTAELYVWSYCPYGVITQEPYIEAIKTLSGTVDAKVILYHDGHGDYELQQNKIQAVIQKYYPELYLDYAAGFVEEIYPLCNSRGTGISDRTQLECDTEESTKLMEKLNIDVTEVMKLIESEGDELFALDRQKASEAQVTGSPSLVLNGVKIQGFSRTAEGIKNAICTGFNDLPEVCSAELENEEIKAVGSC